MPHSSSQILRQNGLLCSATLETTHRAQGVTTADPPRPSPRRQPGSRRAATPRPPDTADPSAPSALGCTPGPGPAAPGPSPRGQPLPSACWGAPAWPGWPWWPGRPSSSSASSPGPVGSAASACGAGEAGHIQQHRTPTPRGSPAAATPSPRYRVVPADGGGSPLPPRRHTHSSSAILPRLPRMRGGGAVWWPPCLRTPTFPLPQQRPWSVHGGVWLVRGRTTLCCPGHALCRNRSRCGAETKVPGWPGRRFCHLTRRHFVWERGGTGVWQRCGASAPSVAAAPPHLKDVKASVSPIVSAEKWK